MSVLQKSKKHRLQAHILSLHNYSTGGLLTFTTVTSMQIETGKWVNVM